MFLIDAGTSYNKILNTNTQEISIVPVSDLDSIKKKEPLYATGHNACLFKDAIIVNELVALAEGAKKLISDNSFSILDIGSRDIKLVTYKDSIFEYCDWNSSCGAMVGFTIDLMMKYFNKTTNDMPLNVKNTLDITCGLLGLTKFFDKLSNGTSIEEGLSSLIKGLARFSWQFAGKPSSLFLSGGLSDNKIFVTHLNELVPDLKSLGRFVLLDGLKQIMEKNAGVKNERVTNSTTRN